ncbi:MAG: sugar phosphate isomerase/epimerase family protein, partial [Bythopirellula sp.]
MNLSLSCRIAESFFNKEEASLSLEQLADLAVACGFDSICMRPSQVGVHSSPDDISAAAQILRAHNLSVSMITGDFDTVVNNDRGPNALRNIGPYLDLAETLRAPLIRVCIKAEDDFSAAQRAADEAIERGIRLVHQCHVQSRFETVDDIVAALRSIDRPNFGLIYEAANLEECRQDYGAATIERLAPWIWNVYLQNQQLKPDGEVELDTW